MKHSKTQELTVCAARNSTQMKAAVRAKRSVRNLLMGMVTVVAASCTAFPIATVAAHPSEHGVFAAHYAGNVPTPDQYLALLQSEDSLDAHWDAIEVHAWQPQLDVSAEADSVVENKGAAPSTQHGFHPRDELLEPKQLRRLKRAELTVEHMLTSREVIHHYKDSPFGTQIDVEIAGESYVAVIERHFHPEGGDIKPWGYHPGVSLFAQR